MLDLHGPSDERESPATTRAAIDEAAPVSDVGGNRCLAEVIVVLDSENGRAEFCARALYHALERVGRPDEIARSVPYLASNDSSFVTGTASLVHGGPSVTRT